MKTCVNTWLAIRAEKRAVTALEYGLLAGVIVATVVVGFNVLGTSLQVLFSAIGNSL